MEITSTQIDHLGLVAGVFDRLGIGEVIDCQWRRKTVQLWRDEIDHLVQKPSPRVIIHTPST